jgi:(p)ppGpp synthase/HD superfamily hydrolase
MCPELTPATGYSLSFDRALMVAGLVHARQKRKGTEVPYLTHPVHVAMVLARHGFPQAVLTAAVLHDVVEDIHPEDPELQHALRDTFPALRDAAEDKRGFLAAFRAFLAAEFGEEVVGLVEAVTDEKHSPDGSRLPWAEAKVRSHARLQQPDTPDLAVALKAADALHNARQIVNDLRSQGLPMMRRFNASPEATLAHYVAVWRIATARLGTRQPGDSLARELGQAVRALADVLEAEFGTACARVRQVVRDLAPDEARG